MCGSMADIQSAAAEIRRGKKEEEEEEEEERTIPIPKRLHASGLPLGASLVPGSN